MSHNLSVGDDRVVLTLVLLSAVATDVAQQQEVT